MFKPTYESCCQQFFFGKTCRAYDDVCAAPGATATSNTPAPTPPISSAESFSEDFEGGDLGVFTTSTDLPWKISDEFGRTSVKNSVTKKGQSSKLTLALDFPHSGILTYELRHDVYMPWATLQVTRDGEVIEAFQGHLGEPEFETHKVIVSEGVHVIAWDVSTPEISVPPDSRGTGTVWVDNVQYEKAVLFDWESEEIDSKLVSFGGIGRWRIDDSQPGAKSGVAIHSPKGLLPGESSSMKIKRNISKAGMLTFEAHIGLGKVFFYVDGELKWSEDKPGRGTQDVEVMVSEGQHTFEWKYEPPPHSNMPMAAVWLDNIMIPL